jgi:hypothetical protein
MGSMGYDRRTTGDIDMDKVLSFAYNWGLTDGAMAEKRGESVI